jgi:DNA-binding transcriptional LysR family regulator
MGPSIKELRYFVTAADKQSLTAAAATLNISQPSISLAVAALERKLGIQLFVRSRARGVALTTAGTDVLREARRLLAQMNDFEAMATQLGEELRGNLTVGCLASLVPRYLATILKSFALQYPQVRVDFTEADQTGLLRKLMTGETELAITLLDLPRHFETEILCELPPYVLISAEHRMASSTGIDLRELASEPAVLLNLPASQEYFLSLFSSLGIVPNIRYRTASLETVRSLVANGLAYSVLNQRSEVMRSLDGQQLARLEINECLPSVRVMAAYPLGMHLRRVTRTFLDHVKQCFMTPMR